MLSMSVSTPVNPQSAESLFLENFLGRFDTERHPSVAVSSQQCIESSQSLARRIHRNWPVSMVGV